MLIAAPKTVFVSICTPLVGVRSSMSAQLVNSDLLSYHSDGTAEEVTNAGEDACLMQTLFCDFLPLPQLHFNCERPENLPSGDSANFFSYRVRPFAPEMPSLLSIISYSNFGSETDGLTAHVTSTSA
jgi:hypothetical protein